MSYNEYRAAKIVTGGIYQDFVVDALSSLIGLHVQVYTSKVYQFSVGESRQGVEIKNDEKYATTGNLWIETGEKARPREGDYAKSGIYRGDNSWLYVIGNYDTIFVFPKTLLILLHRSGKYMQRENGTKTSIGFCLPNVDAKRFAGIVLTPNAAIKVEKHVKDLVAASRQLHNELLQDCRQRQLFGA